MTYNIDFPSIPEKYKLMYDTNTNLYLNTPAQWSQSPYLGAVKCQDGYTINISIPQDIYLNRIKDNTSIQGPDSLFSDKQNVRIRLSGFKSNDPRECAWVHQMVLYGGHDIEELIMAYLENLYNKGGDGISAWKEILDEMPVFEGKILECTDAESFTKMVEQRKHDILKQEKQEKYIDFIASKISKMFKKSKEDLKELILNIGPEHFVTKPGSVKVLPKNQIMKFI